MPSPPPRLGPNPKRAVVQASRPRPDDVQRRIEGRPVAVRRGVEHSGDGDVDSADVASRRLMRFPAKWELVAARKRVISKSRTFVRFNR